MYDIFKEFEDFFDSFDIYPTYIEIEACPGCGRTYQQFRKTSKLGCPKCYEAFRQPLEKVLREIHQNSKHTGKIPESSAAGIKKKKLYDDLKKKLQKAVSEENYEEAAKIHKELKALGNVE